MIMNLQFYLEKLNDSDEFGDFIRENPKAYFCSGFFVIDKEKNDNKTHLDFFNPNNGNIFSFQLEEEIKVVSLENSSNRVLEEISRETEVEFMEIEKLILAEMEKQKVNGKIQKIILSIQKNSGETLLAGTVFLSMFGLLKVSISIPKGEIKEFEKKSFFDIVSFGKKK